MSKRLLSKKISNLDKFGFSALFVVGFITVIVLFLQNSDLILFNPKGLVASQQNKLMVFTAVVLLLITVPSLLLLYFFAWKYRETNSRAIYSPERRHGKMLVVSLWGIPTIVMLILASVMWPATHILNPQKQIDATTKPMTVQVVALRWKWLFIYPEQGIATVNYLELPANTAVQFELTADETPMSSFWIPHLGGQLYAMTGHVNHLNLVTGEPGNFTGSSAEINGSGFSGMKFVTRVSSKQNFNQWYLETKNGGNTLTKSEYEKLILPSENNPTVSYAKTEPQLFDGLLTKYNLHEHPAGTE